MLILQFCSIDFEDNHLQWQSNTFLRQLYLRRPLRNIKGEIEFSQSFLGSIYRSYIFQKSRILNKLDSYINFFEYRYLDGYSNKISTDLEKIYQAESVMITQSLLKDLSNQFPDIARVMVNCSTEKNSLNGQWEWLAQNAEFTPISEPTKVVQSGLSKGNDLVHSDGGHWNPMGNKLFGESLYKSLKDLGLIDSLLRK